MKKYTYQISKYLKELILSEPLFNRTVSELSSLIKELHVSPVEVLDSCFQRIEDVNERVFGFLTLSISVSIIIVIYY